MNAGATGLHCDWRPSNKRPWPSHEDHTQKKPRTRKNAKVRIRPELEAVAMAGSGVLASAVASISAKASALATQFEFRLLAFTWRTETAGWASVTKRATHPCYQRIIGMGQAVVPFILEQLQKDMDDWFWALTAITGENPITEEIAGNVPEMTRVWVEWGKNKRLI